VGTFSDVQGKGLNANDFDARVVSGNFRKRAVAGHEWSIERFGKREVSGVVGCQIAPKRPDPRQENVVRITVERQISEIFKRLRAPLRGHFAGECVAPQDLGDLEIEHMRHVQRVVPPEQPFGHFAGRRRVEQDF